MQQDLLHRIAPLEHPSYLGLAPLIHWALALTEDGLSASPVPAAQIAINPEYGAVRFRGFIDRNASE